MLREMLYHEFGHCNHVASCKNAIDMLALYNLKKLGRNLQYTEEFLNDIKNNEIVKNFHRDYALTSPSEFIADTFAYKMMGKSIPKEVEELYVKYGGPTIL